MRDRNTKVLIDGIQFAQVSAHLEGAAYILLVDELRLAASDGAWENRREQE